MKLFTIASLTLAALLLTACSSQDAHDAPRESKAYESIDPSNLELPALLAHLDLLLQETQTAVDSKAAAEFHHLELALTPTLAAIGDKAGSKSAAIAPTIETLKNLSLKLHEAGHDNNVGMAAKISQKFQSLVRELKTTLQ